MNADWHNASINYALQNVLDRDQLRRGRRGARREDAGARVFFEAGRPFEVRELDLEEPRAGRGARRHGRGRHLRHRPALGQGRVGAADADRARARGRRRRRGGRRRGHGARARRPRRPLLGAACGECADCLRGRPARCLPLQRAIAAGTLAGRDDAGCRSTARPCYRGTATGALAERIVVSRARGAAGRRRCAARAGGAARLRRPDRRRRRAVRGARRAGRVGARRRRRRRGAVRRPGRAHRRAPPRSSCVDPLEARREQALGSGATHAVAPDGARRRCAKPSSDGVDYAFDAVGDPATTSSRSAGRGTADARDRRPAGGRASGSTSTRSSFVRREKRADGHDLRLGGPGRRAADPARPRARRAGSTSPRSLGPSFPLDEVNEAVEAASPASRAACSSGRERRARRAGRVAGSTPMRAAGSISPRRSAGPSRRRRVCVASSASSRAGATIRAGRSRRSS